MNLPMSLIKVLKQMLSSEIIRKSLNGSTHYFQNGQFN